MKKLFHVLLLAVMVCALLSGCTIETVPSKEEEEAKYWLYYLNSSETSLKTEVYSPEEETTDYMLRDLMQRLGSSEAPENYVALLPEDVTVNSYDLQENRLNIDFSATYSDMSKAREIMTRAGIVKTLLQVPDIGTIHFTVDGAALKDTKGQEIADMDENTFLEFSGKDSDSYRYDTITLYFTDKDGERLIPETRTVYYRGTIPKERVVLEQLAKGPMEDGHYATIPTGSVALSVVTADNICYVNMNSAFQKSTLSVSEEVMVYSVVNSILDSCEADTVQISVDGGLEGNFKTELALYNFYQKNEDLIDQESTEEVQEDSAEAAEETSEETAAAEATPAAENAEADTTAAEADTAAAEADATTAEADTAEEQPPEVPEEPPQE